MIDERIGTREAIEEGLLPLGLLGVLIKAKSEGHVERLAPILDELDLVAGFWMRKILRQKVLAQAGEDEPA